MKKTYKSPLEPFSQALLVYWRGNESAVLKHEFKDGKKKSLPISVFFRSHKKFLTTDNAFEHCWGYILVVGAENGVRLDILTFSGTTLKASVPGTRQDQKKGC